MMKGIFDGIAFQFALTGSHGKKQQRPKQQWLDAVDDDATARQLNTDQA